VGSAVVGRGETNDDPHGRLSGAVDSQEPGDPTQAGGEGDVVDSGEGAAVGLGDMVHGNHRDATAAALEARRAVVGALKPFTIR
jgi:hypothetical protein